MAVLAIDFDGVLHDHTHPVDGRTMGPPHDGAQAAMVELADASHTLIVHTCRTGDYIGAWLDYWKIPYDRVTNEKPTADVYLDDRALRHRDWQSTMAALAACLDQ